MNRLYWLNANGDWELVAQTSTGTELEKLALLRLGGECLKGQVGFAMYEHPWRGPNWVMYTHKERGINRMDPVPEVNVPKPIQLLEMLTCD